MSDIEQTVETKVEVPFKKYSSKTTEQLFKSQEELTALQEKKDRLDEKLKLSDDLLAEKTDQVKDLKEQADKNKSDSLLLNETLEQERCHHQDTKENLVRMIEAKSKDNEKYQASEQSKERAYLVLKNDTDTIKDKYDSLKTHHQILETTHNKIKSEIDIQRIKIKNHDLVLQNYEDQLKKLTVENDLLDKEYKRYRLTNVNLNRQLESLQSTYQKYFPNGLNRGTVHGFEHVSGDNKPVDPNDRATTTIEILSVQQPEPIKEDRFKRQVEYTNGEPTLIQVPIEQESIKESIIVPSTKHAGIISYKRSNKITRN